MISINDSEKKIIKVEQIEFWKVYNYLYNTEYPEMIISKNFYKNNKNLFKFFIKSTNIKSQNWCIFSIVL